MTSKLIKSVIRMFGKLNVLNTIYKTAKDSTYLVNIMKLFATDIQVSSYEAIKPGLVHHFCNKEMHDYVGNKTVVSIRLLCLRF